MNKIRIFIALKDDDNRNEIIHLLSELNYVDLVGYSNNGNDALEKIVSLKPKVVFADYKLDGLNGLEIIKYSKEQLDNELPSFNIITNENLFDKTEEIIELVGTNLNSLIDEKNSNRILNIIETYKED